MNPECRSNFVHVLPRFQQPQRILSPSKYAAAGDAPRDQISRLGLLTPTEILLMDSPVLRSATTNDSRLMSKVNDPRAHANVSQIKSFSNGPLGNVAPVIDKDSSSIICLHHSKLMKKNDHKKSKFASKALMVENQLDGHVSLEREPPCKEYSHDTTRAGRLETVTDNDRTTLEHLDSSHINATTEKGDLSNTNDNYSVEEVLFPDRKISMFSKEIWTEKVLPINTIVSPEPKLVEIYFDKKRTTDQFKHSRKYTTKSIDVSIAKRGSSRGVLGRDISMSPPLSARKGALSLSGQRTINFDDEIWPVCPKLIPSGKEVSIPIFENRHEAILPEKLTENSEEIVAVIHPPCSSLKVSSISEVSSRPSTKQYNREGSSRSEKVIEPTHEIEGQNDFSSTSEMRKFYDNNYSPSTISRASIAAVEEAHRFHSNDKIFHKPTHAVNILDRTESDNFWDKLPKSDSLGESRTSQRLTQVSSSKREMKRSFESSQTRILKKNPLSVSSSEPVSTVLTGILNRKEVHSSYEGKLPVVSCNEIISLANMEVKQRKRDCGLNFHACPTAEIVQRDSFASVKNKEIVSDHFIETFHTPPDMVCKISRKMDELPQSSTFSSLNEIREMNVELSSRSQGPPRGIHGPENHLTPSEPALSSKSPEMKSRIIQESINPQRIGKKQKRVKTVHFETCDTKFNDTSTKLRGKFEGQHISRDRSKAHLDVVKTSHTRDCISVESFKQEIDQLANQIATQIEIDPGLDDAVVTLARIELLVEANRQTVEKLQQLQLNVAVPRLTPPDAGKSLAKALMRCRNYMQINGYSSGATDTINKLLTGPVQRLRQLVDRQKLAIAGQAKGRSGIPSGRRQSKTSKELLTVEEFGFHQVQSLISVILALTEKIAPKLNGKGSIKKCSVSPNYSHNGVQSFTRNREAIMDDSSAETNNTISLEESKSTLERHASKVPQPIGKTKVAIGTELEKSVLYSDTSTNSRIGNDQHNTPIQGHRNKNKDLEITQSHVARSTYPKKITATDPTKILKKLYNELWETQSKTLPRHYNMNESPNNFRPQASCHNTTINQKLPVWKPGGNNFVQSSISVIPNNQRVRSVTASSSNRKKNATIEHSRDMKRHQRTKGTSSTIKDKSKTLEKSITKPYNTTSFAKIKTVRARSLHSEILYLDNSKLQVPAEMDEPKARKPRSKSRTRTRTPNNISRVTVTEIPLEHANDCFPLTEQRNPAVKELPLTKKTSSSPKDIIQMLEELIKSSDTETSIHNAAAVQRVARCDVIIKDVNEGVEYSRPFKTDVKLTNGINFVLSNEQRDHSTEESFRNQSIQSKSIAEAVEKVENIAQINDNEFPINEEKASVKDTLAQDCNSCNELDSTTSFKTGEIFSVFKSNSEATSVRSTERQATLSLSNIGYTAEISSENSNDNVFSKCCQASLTSLMNHEIPEELNSSQTSDIGMSSYCEGTQKDSDESFETVGDEKATREDFAQQFQKDQSASTFNGAVPKKKFFNKHAKSLEMLKEILDAHGLDIHLLSRAENELRDRCKYNSNKRGLAARQSLQGANFTTSRFSGELIDRVSLPDRKLSTSHFSKLATLSESESDIEHVEAATMTSANDSSVSTNDISTSARSDSHWSKGDKALSGNTITVENATQFDITSTSDICVGDGIICDISEIPYSTKTQENVGSNVAPEHNPAATPKSSSLTHDGVVVDEGQSLESKLPREIFDAFRLAAIRATNLFKAVHILREDVLPGNILCSNSAVSRDSKEILTHMGISRPFSVANESLLDNDKTFGTDSSIRLPVQLAKAKSASPLRIIIPRIREKVNNEAACCEPTQTIAQEFPKEKVTDRNINTSKGSYQSTFNLDKISPSKPVVSPKPISAVQKAFIVTPERKTVVKEQIINLSKGLTVENRSSRDTEILRSAEFGDKKRCHLASSSQQSLARECITGERIETLHFAGRQSVSVVGNTMNAGLEDIIKSNPRSLNGNSASYGSPKVVGEARDLLAGSRIKTLLEENLQRFKIDYNPIMHGEVFTDFGDQFLTESSDEEVLISKNFAGINTFTSRTRLDDCAIFTEVKDLLNCLINGVEENYESSIKAEQHDSYTRSPRHRRSRKHVRKLRSAKIKKDVDCLMPCDKYRNNLSRIIVSREHLLSLIYAAICSFVFCCLQLSVHCEV